MDHNFWELSVTEMRAHGWKPVHSSRMSPRALWGGFAGLSLGWDFLLCAPSSLAWLIFWCGLTIIIYLFIMFYNTPAG